MLPNAKKSVLELKNDFDEGGRITPKLLRDFLVSAYGSRWVTHVSDSMDVGAEQDILLVKMVEDNNYVRIPDSKADDSSTTPYEYKRYTIVNNSRDFAFRLLTQPNDRFKSDTGLLLQEIQIQPMQVWEVFAYDERWYAYLVGAVPEDIVGKSDIFSRIYVDAPENTTTDLDTLGSDTTSVKWIIRCEDSVNGKYRASELMFTRLASGGDSVEYAMIGDLDLDIQFSVIVDGSDNVILRAVNSTDEQIRVKILRYEIG